MKKLYPLCLLMVISHLAFAQGGAMYTEFAKKIEGFATVAKIDENTKMILMAVDDDNSQLSAVDNKVTEKWRIPLIGGAVGAGMLHGNIVAIGYTANREQNIYTGYLIDKNTGRILLQKIVYQEPSAGSQFRGAFGNEQGSAFFLAFQEAGEKDLKDGLIQSIVRVDINDKLEAVVSTQANLSGTYVAMTSNETGDLFVFTAQQDNSIAAYRCQAGKKTAESPIIQDIDLKTERAAEMVYGTKAAVSAANGNIAWFAMVHKNREKEWGMSIVKLDFGTHTGQAAAMSLAKADIKSLEKNAYQTDEEKYKTNLGDAAALGVTHLEEAGNTVVATLAGGNTRSYQISGSIAQANGANTMQYILGTEILVSAFDLNLKPKFETVLPIYYKWISVLQSSYHSDGKKFYALMSNAISPKMSVTYAAIDLGTGNVEKYETYSDEGHVLDNEALWFKSGFIIPFNKTGGTFAIHKQTIDLQLFNY